MAASAAASSWRDSAAGSASANPCASRKGAMQSKPHSRGRTMRFSSRVVSRVSQAYIQRAYQWAAIRSGSSLSSKNSAPRTERPEAFGGAIGALQAQVFPSQPYHAEQQQQR